MAGRKQHFIPQSLSKGFEASSPGKSIQVYVYRANKDCYLSSTEGVAAERDFYSGASTSSDPTLDDNITIYEGDRFTTLLNELRQSIPNGQVDPKSAAEIISHLVVRGAYIRGVFKQAVDQFAVGAMNFFSSEENVRTYMGIDRIDPEPGLSEELDNAIQYLRDHIPAQLPEHLIKRILLVWLREDFSEMFVPQIPQLNAHIVELARRTPDMARDGHAQALAKTIKPVEISNTLATLHWTVIDIPTANLILPDCVAISKSAGHDCKYESYLLSDRENLAEVLMPLNSRKLLVGKRDAAAAIDTSEFNRWAAECSHDFFVSSKAFDDIAALAKLIGTHTVKYTQSIVQDSIFSIGTKELTNQIVETTDISFQDSGGIEDADSPLPMHHYTVSFLDCADTETANVIAAVVGVVFNTFAKVFSLNRVDSIAFAHDYPAALGSIDRGFIASPLVLNSNGVAMAPIVIRDGEIRCSIVMQCWIGHALIDKGNSEDFHLALYVIESMLARVALVELVDKSLPGTLLKSVDDRWTALFFQPIEHIFSTYFSARVACEFLPTLSVEYRTNLKESLLNAHKIIPAARLAYRSHADLDAFLGVATDAIGDVLLNAAKLIGHCDGLKASATDEAQLTATLESTGTRKWLEVYRRDLNTLYDRLGQWSSFNEFTQLSVHVERLLWQYSVFPWRNDAGEVRVEIPIESDAQALLDMSQR
jgi:hypothetical protein